jgi:predicted short-subunit dehydrogenase-like oxidoreductase (DUF2520 family)
MTKTLRLGLVSEGPLKVRALFRTPAVQAGLGPVRAGSLRVASRLANTLAAGRASRSWQDFESCEVILVSAPAAGMTRIVRALLASGLDWRGRTVALYQCARESAALEPLARRGASIGSIVCLEELEPVRYVLEGAPAAVRTLRKLLAGSPSLAIAVEPGGGFLVTAAETFALELVVPLLDAAAGCLRQAGIDRKPSVELVDQMVRISLRRYQKAGQRAWRGSLASADAVALQAQREALRRANPRAEALFAAVVDAALTFLRPPEKAWRAAAGAVRN